MNEQVKELFIVALKRKSGDWEIRQANMILDRGNSFRPIIKVTLNWPDGISGIFRKVSVSGRLMYVEQ